MNGFARRAAVLQAMLAAGDEDTPVASAPMIRLRLLVFLEDEILFAAGDGTIWGERPDMIARHSHLLMFCSCTEDAA